jgi:hypothetical protein
VDGAAMARGTTRVVGAAGLVGAGAAHPRWRLPFPCDPTGALRWAACAPRVCVWSSPAGSGNRSCCIDVRQDGLIVYRGGRLARHEWVSLAGVMVPGACPAAAEWATECTVFLLKHAVVA